MLMEIALNQLFRRRRKRKNDNICVIKGSVKGNIVSQGSVIVGDTGYYTGKINAVVVEIAGEFRGSIEAIKLVVHPRGYVHYQDAKYERLVLHDGGVLAQLNGAKASQVDDAEAAAVSLQEELLPEAFSTQPAQFNNTFAEAEAEKAAPSEQKIVAAVFAKEENEELSCQFGPSIMAEQPQTEPAPSTGQPHPEQQQVEQTPEHPRFFNSY